MIDECFVFYIRIKFNPPKFIIYSSKKAQSTKMGAGESLYMHDVICMRNDDKQKF